MRFLDAFRRTVRCHGSDTAIVADDGRSFTYDEFDERSTRLANALHDSLGETRVAVLGRNGPEVYEAMLAGHKRGVATVQLPFRGKPGELVPMCETADAGGLLFDDANVETAVSMLESGSFDVAVHVGDADVPAPDVESYEDVLAGADPDLSDALPLGDECAVFYTSGTTSLPKAVPFDGEQMWLGAVQGVMEHGIDRADVALVTTPWYHMVTTDAWLYPHFLAGATVVTHPGFDPEAVLEDVEAHSVTGLLAVPTQLDALVEAQQSGGYDTDSLDYIRTGGSVLSERLVERVNAHLGDCLYNTYGMTEGGPNLSFAYPEDQVDHPGTIGKEAHTYELRVVETAPITERPDPEATVGPGETGEVIARGPGMATGYIDNPDAEARTFFDGWLRTRDVAEIDEDGYLYVVDRVDNMFLSGGENIYPVEVEHALLEHPAVDEAFVFGVEDDRWGQVVSCVLVTDGSVTEADVDEFCREETDLADYKRPRRYQIRTDPLPRTSTGKLKRDEVLAGFED